MGVDNQEMLRGKSIGFDQLDVVGEGEPRMTCRFLHGWVVSFTKIGSLGGGRLFVGDWWQCWRRGWY